MTWQRDQSLAGTRSESRSARGESTGVQVEPQTHTGARVKRLNAKSAAVKRTSKLRAPSVHDINGEHGKIEKAKIENEGYLIKELQHRLRTQIEARIRAKGLWLSFPHSVVLMTLREEPGLSGAQLARRNSVTAQTMNGLLMPLESKGLIERRADPENARILKCFLKPKGVEVLEQGMHEASVVFNLMMGKLSERERDEFRRILRRCIDALQAGGAANAEAGCSPQTIGKSGKKTPKRKTAQY